MKNDLSAHQLLDEINAELARNTATIERLHGRNKELEVIKAFISAKVDNGGKRGIPDMPPPLPEDIGAPPGGRFATSTIVDAAFEVLTEAGPPGLDTRTIIGELEAGGWRSRAKDPYTSVFGTLLKETKREKTKLAKGERGIWLLREWDAEDRSEQSSVALPRFQGLGEERDSKPNKDGE